MRFAALNDAPKEVEIMRSFIRRREEEGEQRREGGGRDGEKDETAETKEGEGGGARTENGEGRRGKMREDEGR